MVLQSTEFDIEDFDASVVLQSTEFDIEDPIVVGTRLWCSITEYGPAAGFGVLADKVEAP